MKAEYKIIADHLRSSCFLIADGVMPSNEGRGYVLRRIMRRAMRQLHKLGARKATMYQMVDPLINEMGNAYPELSRARAVIVETLKIEEEKFRETLEKGLKILEEELLATKNGVFSGTTSFKLYDTYGFPLDLTQDILKEKNLEVDLKEFEKEMEEQRNRARKNWAGSGEKKDDDLFFELKNKFGETKFLGYEATKSVAKILAIIENPAAIILDQTPFYATSGGQKGDDGIIKNSSLEIEISETKKFAGGLFAHLIGKINGENNLKIGDEVEAIVNAQTRQMRAQNHSATHLLHKALKEILGNSISQKGSNVDSDYLTFDFNFNRAMSEEEIAKVEKIVNEQIAQNNQVNTNLMALEEAKASGAEALFGEKYDANVRVVKMGSSVELCGGTHVKSTGEIEIFKIISEKGIAAGIRRIEARSSISAKKYLQEQQEKLENFVAELRQKNIKKSAEIITLGGTKSEFSSAESNLEKLVEILQQEIKKQDKEIDRLKKQNLLLTLKNIKAEVVGDVNLIAKILPETDAKDIREVVTEIKNRPEFSNSHIFAFFGDKDGKVAVCLALSNNLQDKFDAAKLIAPIVEAIGGKGGGGKKDLAMGGGSNIAAISNAINLLKNLIK